MSNGFKQYDYPIGPTPEGSPMGPEKKPAGGGGWFLPMLAEAGLSALATYFSTKSQTRSTERGWQYELELERMRNEAKKELDRERRTLDPAIYAMLKKELLRPGAPHGEGAGRPQTGTFREMLEPQRQRATPMGGGSGLGVGDLPAPSPKPPAPAFKGGGGQGFDLNKYLMGGGR